MLQLPRTCSKTFDTAHCSLEEIMGMSRDTWVLVLSSVILAWPVSQLWAAVRGAQAGKGLLDSAGPDCRLQPGEQCQGTQRTIAVPLGTRRHRNGATGHMINNTSMSVGQWCAPKLTDVSTSDKYLAETFAFTLLQEQGRRVVR